MSVMKAALLAIALMLGLAAPAGPRQEGAPAGGDEGRAAGPHAAAVAARPDGVLVIAALSPERAIVADPLTGRTRERELPGGTLCHGPLLAVGDRFVYFDLHGRRLVARAAPIDRRGRSDEVGAADVAVRSATPGRLWLGELRRGQVGLREVDMSGVVHARTSTPLARWGSIEAHVGGDFLTTRGSGLALGRERFPGIWLVAAHPERFAWCADPCPRVGLWSGGERSVLEPPAGVLPHRPGAFSPDGQRLALAVTVDKKPRFAVVDLTTNDWSVVPGARPGDYSALAWSPSGRWLYLATKNDRLLASRDGTGRPRRLPIRTGGTVMSIATASRPGSAAR
jgi:hypothetical protein